jgi:hypothetical protein
MLEQSADGQRRGADPDLQSGRVEIIGLDRNVVLAGRAHR